jgi:hypothetical protein
MTWEIATERMLFRGSDVSNQILEIHQSGSYHYTFSEWHKPIASVQPGQRVRIHCVDGFKKKPMYLFG